MLKRTGGPALKRVGGGAIQTIPAAGGSSLDVLTLSDLSYVGSYQLSAHQNTCGAMAIRWRDSGGNPVYGRAPTASDVRHFLFYSTNGHLIEYKEVSAPSTGGPSSSFGTYAGINSLTETRRWYNWSNYSQVNAAFPSVVGGLGMAPTMFRWEPGTTASNGRLWYAWVPGYPGDTVVFANLQYVVLDDAEARAAGATSGVEVSSGNRSGYFYFKGTAADQWKDGTQGVTKIPDARLGNFSGYQFLTVGSNQGNIGDGARGVCFWVVPEYPTTSPTTGDTIWTTATQIYETGGSSGVTPATNMWRPANLGVPPGSNVMTPTTHYVTAGGSYSFVASGDTTTPRPLPLNVGDMVYFSGYNTNGYADVINVRMTTPASGGSFVIERWTGSAWAEPGDLAIHLGDRAMTASNNVFYFNSVASVSSQPHASMSNHFWWRLRRTVAGTTGGHLWGVYATTSQAPGYTGAGTTRPVAVGGYIADHAAAVAAYNSDKDASHGYAYAPDYTDGTCWVRTNAVEGILCAGKFSSGAAWYGDSSMFARTTNVSGTPTHYVDSIIGPNDGNGNWSAGSYIFYFFIFNADHLEEAFNDPGTRPRNANGIQPVEYIHVRHHFTIPTDQVAAEGSLDYPGPNDRQTHFGQCMEFDPINNQVLYYNSRAGGTNPLLMIWNVRNS